MSIIRQRIEEQAAKTMPCKVVWQRPLRFGNDAPVRNDVIDIFGAYRTGKAEVVDLDRGGPLCKHPGTRLAEITIQIDENVYLIFINGRGGRWIAELAYIDNPMQRSLVAPAHIALIVPSVVEAIDFKSGAIVKFDNADKKM